jgi:hypothetical protein
MKNFPVLMQNGFDGGGTAGSRQALCFKCHWWLSPPRHERPLCRALCRASTRYRSLTVRRPQRRVYLRKLGDSLRRCRYF